MTGKEFLSQAYLMELQVQSKMQQLCALRSLAQQLTVPISQTPGVHAGDPTAMQNRVIRIVEMEEELNRQIDELVDKKAEIGKMIARVQNVANRVILEKRYLCFLPWDKIAADMGLSVRWTRFRHNEGVEEVDKLMEQDGKS